MSDVAIRGRTSALIALTAASVTQIIDPTVNNVAIVGAAADLGMSPSQRAFAASIGTLALAASILTTGSLGDRFGRRRVMLLGLIGTIGGGLITALAPTTAVFIGGRVLTGIGIAAAFGLSFALVRTAAADNVAKGVAFWIGAQTAAAIPLQLLAGAMTSASWRFGFILLPVASALALALCLKWAPEAKAADPRRFDALGLGAIAIALVGLLYGLSQASSEGWTDPVVLVPIGAGLAAFAFFLWWEARISEPAFPVRMFSDPELAGSVATGVSFNIWQAVLMIQLSLMWQYIFGYTPLSVSLGQLPMSLAMVAGALWTGRMLARRTPVHRLLLLGHGLLIGSTAYLAFAGPDSVYLFFLLPLVVGGFGRIVNETVMGGYFVSKAPPQLVGAMASAKTAIGQTSFALGTALSLTFLFSSFTSSLQEAIRAADLTPHEQGRVIGVIQQYAAGGADEIDPTDLQQIIEPAREIYVDAFSQTLWIFTAILVALALVSTYFFAKAPRADQEDA